MKAKPAVKKIPVPEGRVNRSAFFLVLIGFFVYLNSFWGVFVFDDAFYMAERNALQTVPPPWSFFMEDADRSISTRPLVNLTIAFNYALGGVQTWGYHAVNLLVHLGAGLALFGLMRRLFLSPALQNRYAERATTLAFVISLLWLVHPLQTQSVTYIIQRAEAIMGLFYILTLYAVARTAEEPAEKKIVSKKWMWLAMLFCSCGMASKGVMVTAPFLAWGIDAVFFAGSFGEALRRRWKLYLGLAATGALLILLWVLGTRNVQGLSAGFSIPITPWEYARTQPGVILHYLRLVFWPHPLILDYGWPIAEGFRNIALPAFALAGGSAAVAAFFRWKREALFALIAFFAILAPTSSVFPIADLAFEHRMYLPLAPLAALVVLGLDALVARFWFVIFIGAAVVALGFTTILRNRDYSDEMLIWKQITENRPQNARAHDTLGYLLWKSGSAEKAMPEVLKSLEKEPNNPGYHNSLGILFARMGRYEDAIKCYTQSLALDPEFEVAHHNLGIAYAKLNQHSKAADAFKEALRLKPRYFEAYYALSQALSDLGKNGEARESYLKAIEIKPDYADAYVSLGVLDYNAGDMKAAEARYLKALSIKRDHAEAHNNLGAILYGRGDKAGAIRHFEQALEARPDYVDAKKNLERVKS